MYTKPTWVRILTETIGIPQIITFIIGVPAMIGFICVIWQALSFSHQVIAVILGIVVLVAIILFVYFQTKKKLYVIPKLILKIHQRTIELAANLKIEDMALQDFTDFISLTDIDTKQLETLKSSIPDIDSLINLAPELIRLAEMGAEHAKTDKEAVWRLQYFMYGKVGLKQAIKQDKIYQKLKRQLDSIQIPNPIIERAIFDCESLSLIMGTWSPVLQAEGIEKIQDVFPLSYKIDRELKIDELGKQIKLAISKLIEVINGYYKGGN